MRDRIGDKPVAEAGPVILPGIISRADVSGSIFGTFEIDVEQDGLRTGLAGQKSGGKQHWQPSLPRVVLHESGMNRLMRDVPRLKKQSDPVKAPESGKG